MKAAREHNSMWNYVLWGSFGVVASAMLLSIVSAIVLPRVVHRVIERYTDLEPETGVPFSFTESQYEALESRVNAFADAAEQQFPQEPLVLSSEEVGALIQRALEQRLNRTAPEIQAWLRIEGDQLKGPVSIRVDDAPAEWLEHIRGRYLNGVATFRVQVEAGSLDVVLDGFEIDGEPIPGWVRDALQERIDEAVAESEELRDSVSKLASLQFYDSKAVVRSYSSGIRADSH